MVLAVYRGHGIVHPVRSSFDFSPNQFLGEVLSSQVEELQKKTRSTSIVARAFFAENDASSTVAGVMVSHRLEDVTILVQPRVEHRVHFVRPSVDGHLSPAIAR